MPPVKDKQSRSDRILQFIQENRELKPVGLTSPRKEDESKQKKRVTFIQAKKPRSSGGQSLPKVKERDVQIGLGLTSCLITKSSDTRVCGGENNPAERDVGKLPRTDSECRFHSPGMHFLRERNENCTSQVLKLVPPKPIRKELKNKCDFFPKFYDNSPFKDQTTQTLYRESSAQTLAYLPEIQEAEKSQKLELFSLSQVLPGDKPPGLQEVEILERSRRRWLFRDALKHNFQSLFNEAREFEIKTKYKPILEAFEWEQWIEREESIQECQMMRLEIVIKMFNKREKEMHASSNARIEQACERIEKRRQAGLRKNEIEYQRGMRRITMQLAKTSRKWEKQDTLLALGSPCSEFYGPMIRHGVDPSRRNFAPTTGHKAFDMRIDDLEKKVNMKNIQCPFRKLKDWSTPKEYVREYEQNFCNDDNLQKLYESLKTLRTQQDLAREAPECLKTRIQREAAPFDSGDSYDSFRFTGQYDSRKTRQTVSPRHQKNKSMQDTRPFPVTGKLEGKSQLDFEALIRTYEGNYIGWIMQFLADEMTRLKEQRKLHFFSILAQKERWRREAQEAGIRQKENNVRLLYEELFQNCNSLHQELSNAYIERILSTDVKNIVENLAEQETTEEAMKIDEDIERWLESFKLIQNPLTFAPLRLMLRDMVSPNMDAALIHHEKTLISQYIVEDVIFDNVWKLLEPFDIATTLTSDLIDRLIDNDLYLFSSDSESETGQPKSWVEVHAILRKLIRYAVPGKRWKEEDEVVVEATYKDLFDEIFDAIIFKAENVPPLGSSELLSLCSEDDVFRFTDETAKKSKGRIINKEVASVDATDAICAADSLVLHAQLLNLIKKYNQEKITAELKTDEMDNDGSDEIHDDKLIRAQVLSPITPEKLSSDSDIFSVTSVTDIREQGDNLTMLRSHHSRAFFGGPPRESTVTLHLETQEPEANEGTGEGSNRSSRRLSKRPSRRYSRKESIVKEEVAFGDEILAFSPTMSLENEEDSETPNSYYTYGTKDSQLFNFR
ncbi:uncharacterized protein Dana_GF15094 [Drosophila ananassae]|uniref:Cilia- and flagella-associated protein 91 n=1 Tax=Drosophila ananassae TaxID=7217 RepID=B3MMG8_DROAN|nr:uncharacterized protein LOC6497907 [Drosophila ananassae]EDV30914.2 uncharacterized protein Dana_GF15094 [Drosophila ananassae]